MSVDPFFKVQVIQQTPSPQQLIWISAHQCVCEGIAIDDPCPTEEDAGHYVVKHLLAGDRGHWSPFEAPQISFNVSGFNHRTMQQITRHRVGVHYSVQSLRYTGDRFSDLGQTIFKYAEDHGGKWEDDPVMQGWVEELFYLRPPGTYSDRDTGDFEYTDALREQDIVRCGLMAVWYYKGVLEGKSHEQAAGLLPMDTRQHWVMSFNVRSLLHLMDLRSKSDAQLEAQQLCELIWPHFKAWVPSVADWYEKHRMHKARLAP